MRISELSERSGVPVATVKYYLREGLLAPGEPLNARESSYDDSHVARLALIRGLVHVLGASIAQVHQVLTLIEAPGLMPLEAMGNASSALPTVGHGEGEGDQGPPQRAIDVLTKAGLRFDPASPNVRQLDTALGLADSVGIPVEDEHITAYIQAARQVARADFDRIPWADLEAATTFAVLGTAVYEPVLAALRRLAHYELGVGMSEAGEVDSR